MRVTVAPRREWRAFGDRFGARVVMVPCRVHDCSLHVSAARAIIGTALRTSLAAIVILVAAGCSAGAASPTAPGNVETEFMMPSVLAASQALIDADERPVEFLDEAGGPWMRRTVRGVVLDSTMPAGVRAQCCGSDRLIHWSTGWLPNPSSPHDVRVAAAILVHEARHAEGYRHTCPDQRRDRTVDEGGAWAVHAAWLRHMGDNATANSITTLDIGCQ
jgi:hypothetical protein